MDTEKKTLFSGIVADLTSQINTGKFSPGDQIPTELALAQQYGVSRITSKRALEELERAGYIYRQQGSGSFVRQRFSEQNAQAMSGTKFAALIMPFANNLGNSMSMITEFNSVLNTEKVLLTIHNSHNSKDEERNLLNMLVESGAQAIALYPISHRNNLDLLYHLKLKGFPLVVLDKYIDAFDLNCVLSDNFSGGYLAAEYLIGLGHRNICFLSDRDLGAATSVRDRCLGFYKAHWDHNIECDEQNIEVFEDVDVVSAVHQGEDNEQLLDKGKTIFERIYQNKPNTTAIQCINDYMAIFMLRVARRMGISIPGQLSIVGFDNSEICSHLDVPLTTINQDVQGIGQAAAECILELMRPDAVNRPIQKKLVPVKLVVRDSCTAVGQMVGVCKAKA